MSKHDTGSTPDKPPLARLAHDMHNFLAPIRNVAQVLRMRGAADPDLKAMADMLDRQVSAASALLDGLSGAPQPAPPAARPAAAQSGSTPRRRILIADDNAALRASLGGMLQDLGHETASAEDGPAALRTACSWKPDVVFLDVHMPGLGGFEVARQLRAQFAPSAMRLVMMSGDTLNELAVRGAKEAGFDDCIDKLSGIAVFESVLAGDAAGG
jgi:CheY-like chemotaxis protein